jgi:hypothetical protein
MSVSISSDTMYTSLKSAKELGTTRSTALRICGLRWEAREAWVSAGQHVSCTHLHPRVTDRAAMQTYVFVAQAGDELGLTEDLHGALAVIKQVGDLLDGHLLARHLVVRAPV